MLSWLAVRLSDVDEKRITGFAEKRQQITLVPDVWMLIAPHNDLRSTQCTSRLHDLVPHISNGEAFINWDVMPVC